MNASPVALAAVDLGASSGRVIVGHVGPETLTLEETHRFPNLPVELLGTLHWDVLELYRAILDGLRDAVRSHPGLASVGIDTWGVDYGLVDAAGGLLGNPVHYRDRRSDGVMERVLDEVTPRTLYQTTGIQMLPFNTIFQLLAAADSTPLRHATRLLLIPDLLSYWLTGEQGAEITNASTTQLLDVNRMGWADSMMKRLGIETDLFPPLRKPGEPAGSIIGGARAYLGLERELPVTVVGSHDTASAVVGVPAADERFAFVSCGTWSLAGVELDRPVLSEESRLANFTNEVGVDGTIRYLKNVMGLWLLQECLRTWAATGMPDDLETLIAKAGRVAPFRALIDPDDPMFLPPGDMPSRIAAFCRRTGQDPPGSAAETVRCIMDSLALAHRQVLRQTARLSGESFDVVHIVGGGARNELLCQLTADACGLSVEAGPVEATAIGNLLVQARTAGALSGGLSEMRDLCRRTQRVKRYEPGGDDAAWEAAAARVGLASS